MKFIGLFLWLVIRLNNAPIIGMYVYQKNMLFLKNKGPFPKSDKLKHTLNTAPILNGNFTPLSNKNTT